MTTRAYAAQPPLPKTARKGSIRPVESSHRSRWASSAWRHSSAMPGDPEDHGPEQHALAEDRLEAEHPAEEEGADRDRRPGAGEPSRPSRPASPAAGAGQAGRLVGEPAVRRQEDPQRGVQQDAEAVDQREHHERHPHPQHGDAEVAREAGRDAAGHGGGRVAVGTAYGQWGTHRATIVAGQDHPSHEARPRLDPEVRPRGHRHLSGSSPMVRRRRRAHAGAMDTTTPPPDQPEPPATDPPAPVTPPTTEGPRVSSEQMRDLGRLRRSVTDRRVAGVAGGLARHLDVDPIIVRVALVVLVFFGGSGLLLYAAGWLLVPEEGTADQPLGLDERSRRIALIGAGVLAGLAALGDWAGAFWFPWPVVIVALVVLWFLNRNQQHAVPPTSGYGSSLTGSTYDGFEQARTHLHGTDVHRPHLRPGRLRAPPQPPQARAPPLLVDPGAHRDRDRHPGRHRRRRHRRARRRLRRPRHGRHRRDAGPRRLLGPGRRAHPGGPDRRDRHGRRHGVRGPGGHPARLRPHDRGRGARQLRPRHR